MATALAPGGSASSGVFDAKSARGKAAKGENGMSNERFNELLNGPLSHPLPMFTMTRLALALRAVVDATGEAGERALEEHCAGREESDQRKAGE